MRHCFGRSAKTVLALGVLMAAMLAQATGFIVAAKREGGIINLHRMNLDGSGETALTSFGTDAYGPSISPDGSKIAFNSSHTGSSQLFVMNSDGSGMQQVTTGSMDSLFPSWSPDGAHLLFQRGIGADLDLFTMDAAGTNVVNITNTPGTLEANADWSRSTGQIAFTRGHNGSGDVWKMAGDGSGQVQLTSGGWDEWAPKWAPDGSQLAFHALAGGSNWKGWTMGADGSNQHVFTQLLGAHAYPAYWATDRVLLNATTSGINPEGLFWLNPDGTNRQLIHEGLYVGATASPVPEPMTLVTLGSLVLAAGIRRTRSRKLAGGRVG